MLGTLIYAGRLVRRTPGRTLTYLFGLALAVGLFATILFFVDASSRRMTSLALAPVQLDMVGHGTAPDLDPSKAAAALAKVNGITAAEPVISADFASATKKGNSVVSPAGRLFGIQSSYLTTFDLLTISQGKFDTAGALISEPLAIAQKIAVGDTIVLTFTGIDHPITLTVSGLLDTTHADALFAASEAANTVIANLVFVDIGWFNTRSEYDAQGAATHHARQRDNSCAGLRRRSAGAFAREPGVAIA